MNLKQITGISILTLALPLAALAAGKTIPEGKFNIDPMHSKIGFEIPHLVISSVEGKFDKFEGKIHSEKAAEKSKVEFSADIASIDTSVADRDKHLKSADFFDEKKFPKMTFTSTKVTQSDDTLTIVGDLKIKDKTKPVTITAKYLGEVKDGFGQDKIAFKGSTKINRKDFGLTWSKVVEAGPVVGDEVTISLNIQATKEK